jgi:hypothetical protein
MVIGASAIVVVAFNEPEAEASNTASPMRRFV